MPRFDYSCIGFITFDCLGWPVTKIPDGGGTIFIDDLTLAVSGAAGTAVIAAAKMGLECEAVGGLGTDMMGEWVLHRLHQFGIDTTALKQIPGARTSSSIVTTRPDGSRPALHMKGATGDFFIDDDLMPQVIDARVVHLGGVGLMTRMDQGRNAELAKRAQVRGAITTVDIFAGSKDDMPAVASVLPFTDYFMPSIEEAHALTGRDDLEGTAQFFLDKGVTCCVFTLGADGAYYHHEDGTHFKIPAFEVAVRCTCGCGDAFDAGFAVALCRGMDPETAVRFAQATSALNATGLGSQAGVENFERTWEFMNTTPVKRALHAAGTPGLGA
jgi:sugar/nucleoside kinase (ribokinase family)